MLTQKQEKFVQELVKGKSQREAYKAAYDAEKMKDKSIDNLASRLFEKVEIRSRYEELMHKSVAKTEYTATEVRAAIIKQLMAIVNADINDYYDFQNIVLGKGSKALLKNLTDIDTKAVQYISTDRFGNNHVRLYDKMSAASKLIEMLGLQQTESEASDGISINVPEEYTK